MPKLSEQGTFIDWDKIKTGKENPAPFKGVNRFGLTQAQVNENIKMCREKSINKAEVKLKKESKGIKYYPELMPRSISFEPTERQQTILDYIYENQPCTSIDVSNALGVSNGSMWKQIRAIANYGYLAQHKESKLWYDPQNKPKVMKKNTLKQKAIDFIESKGVVHESDIGRIVKNPLTLLSSLENVISIGDRKWKWVG